MNDLTRKAANALVAAVDFFQGALLAEAQAGDAKQVQLDALVGQLKVQASAQVDTCNALENADKEVARLRELLEAEQRRSLEVVGTWNALRQERDEVMLELEELREDYRLTRECSEISITSLQGEVGEFRRENDALREVAMRARVLLPLKPGTKAYEKARELLVRDVRALDD